MHNTFNTSNIKDLTNKNDKYTMNYNNLFFKDIECPVCNKTFKTLAVKVNAPRIKSRDSDFFIRYLTENPYFYEVWICPSCGYSALKTDFKKIRKHQSKLILSQITPKWVNREYPVPFNEKVAIERYKLSLVNSLVIENKSSTNAILCLRIAWMYRLLGNEIYEKNYLTQSLISFNDAYTNETLPIYGLDRFSVMFLIGEINRRIGEEKIALRWFSEVITSIGAPQKIKEMARDCKDKIGR